MPSDLIIRSRRVLLPSGIVPARLHVRDGTITQITPLNQDGSDRPGGSDIDVGNDVVLPGLVDTHVHLNEPGRTDWEGFATGTRAAAAGGVTTVVDMPLNSVPSTTTVDALEQKLAAAEGKCAVDVGFWGGLVPGNETDLEPLWRAGVLGFKAFLVPSGVPEFAHVGESDLRRALPMLERLGAPLLAHSELPECLERAQASVGGRRYDQYLDSRPEEAEERAVSLMVGLARETGARVHIVHVSSAGSIPILNAARREGLPVTAETCPHYLWFDAETVAAGDDANLTLFKCAPPIRRRAHAERLWKALRDGDLDVVASDHSPCPPAMKKIESHDIMAAWGGIASLQLGLPLIWTLARRRGITLERVIDWMSGASARLAGLDERKGAVAVGRDADLVVFDPDADISVTATMLHDRHKLTPYIGESLRGVVRMTFVRGQLVYDRGSIENPAAGQPLVRP